MGIQAGAKFYFVVNQSYLDEATGLSLQGLAWPLSWAESFAFEIRFHIPHPCLHSLSHPFAPLWAKEKNAQQKVTDLGGRLFHKKSEVVEVVLNGASFKSGELKFLANFPQLTDLSLEKTSASDEDMVVVAKLPNLSGSTFTERR